MKISDFQIHDRQKLDSILVELCEMIIDGKKKDPDYYGMVASCVLDTKNNKVCAVNYFKSAGKRVHGERAAIDKYQKKYGKIPPDSIIITTCSPCSEDMSERYGDSCTDLIDSLGIRKVYSGYSDPTQDESDNYNYKKFHVETTKNKQIESLCKKFADTFLKNTP